MSAAIQPACTHGNASRLPVLTTKAMIAASTRIASTPSRKRMMSEVTKAVVGESDPPPSRSSAFARSSSSCAIRLSTSAEGVPLPIELRSSIISRSISTLRSESTLSKLASISSKPSRYAVIASCRARSALPLRYAARASSSFAREKTSGDGFVAASACGSAMRWSCARAAFSPYRSVTSLAESVTRSLKSGNASRALRLFPMRACLRLLPTGEHRCSRRGT
jgi:hypothetical protein